MREKADAKIVNLRCVFQSRYLDISGRTRKTEALKYKLCLVMSMDAKERIERKKSLI